MDKQFSVRLIIAGGRDFADYPLLKTSVSAFLKEINADILDMEIVSGHASGADFLGEIFAKSIGVKVTTFPADWESHGKAAGPIRNRKMAEYATHCIAFWDFKSSGSRNMIKQAQEKGLPLRVIAYSQVPKPKHS